MIELILPGLHFAGVLLIGGLGCAGGAHLQNRRTRARLVATRRQLQAAEVRADLARREAGELLTVMSDELALREAELAAALATIDHLEATIEEVRAEGSTMLAAAHAVALR